MNTKPMLETVRDALDATRGNWREIARESGMSYSTLCKIAQRVIPNPGVLGVQALYDYFRRTKSVAGKPRAA